MLRRRSLALAVAPLSAISRRQALLALELAAIMLGLTAAATYLRQSADLPLVTMLIPVVAIMALVVARDPDFSLRAELRKGFARADVLAVLALFSCTGIALAIWMYLRAPERLLAMPSHHTAAWLTIVLAYPILSALPQELLFRTLFFHRYRALLPIRSWLAIAMNGCLFGYAHIIYWNAVSVVLTCCLGTLLAYRYTQTRSLWLVWIEHSLYGELVFTVGLGHYFLLNPPH
jgi:hypothetical protein